MMVIKYSPNVIGCRIGNEIYLNPHLKECPRLYRAILMHEKKHSNRFTIGDLKLDLQSEDLKGIRREYWGFMIKHPRAFLSFLPVTKVGKYWGVDIAMCLFWTFMMAVFGMIFTGVLL